MKKNLLKTIYENIQKTVKEQRFWIFLIVGVLLIFENFICIRIYDDEVIFNTYKNSSLLSGWKAMINLKTSWSSRFFSDLIMLILQARMPFFVWQILNSIVCIVIVYAMDKIFNKEKKFQNTILIAMINFLFPYFFVGTAGWIATTVTYYWTLAAAIICLGILDVVEKYEKKSITYFIVIILTGLFACENELCCVFITIMAFAYFLNAALNKKFNVQSFAMVLVAFCRLLIHLVWKKYGGRVAVETKAWFPDFANLSFVQKIQIGITTTFHFTFIDYPLIPFLLCLAIAFFVFKKHKDIFHRITILFPLVIFGMSLICNNFQMKGGEQNLFSIISRLDRYYSNFYGSISEWRNKINVLQFVEPMIWTIALCCILFSVISISESKREAILISFLLFASLCSRFPMGLSPTNVASSWRTYTYLSYGMLAVLVFYSIRIEKSCTNKGKILLWIFVLSGGFNFLLTLTQILSKYQENANEKLISYTIDENIMTVCYNDFSRYSKMIFPTWSDADGQDDLIWYNAARNEKGNWEVRIDLNKHPNHEKLIIHFYQGEKSDFVVGKEFIIR